jgi:hypothetical protein
MTLYIHPRLSFAIALCALFGASTLRAMATEPPTDGIWKFKVPEVPIHGEFNDEDPVGLAAGTHLKTDCSINMAADDGKVYCFTIRTSLEFFEGSPRKYIIAAREFYAHDQPSAPQRPQPQLECTPLTAPAKVEPPTIASTAYLPPWCGVA